MTMTPPEGPESPPPPRRRRRGIIAIALIFLAALAIVRSVSSGPEDPVYEGRTLTSWLEGHLASSSARPPYNSPGWKKANDALIAIGTNAIPTLLEMIQAEEQPPYLLKLRRFATKTGLIRKQYRHPNALHEEAEHAFRVLGETAADAVPGLIEIYEENLSASSQRCAALSLASIGPKAQAAIPTLLNNFTHSDGDVRFYAVSATLRLNGDPELMMPAFASVLDDPTLNVRWSALSGLGRMGSRARPFVPEILKRLDDEGMLGRTPIRTQVETTLWRIAPEQVGKPIVVAPSAPMLTNGVLAQALVAFDNGRRRILIPAGKTVPRVAQHWNSEPPSPLSIYRSENGDEATDHFLGDFEVLGLPKPPESINAPYLCIITEENIYLGVRDYNRKIFLEIRRMR